MPKFRTVPIMAPGVLETMHTGSLVARLRKLWKCENSFELSDRQAEDPSAFSTGMIEFKDSPEWRQAHQELKVILSRREHLATGGQRRLKRLLRAKRNRSKP